MTARCTQMALAQLSAPVGDGGLHQSSHLHSHRRLLLLLYDGQAPGEEEGGGGCLHCHALDRALAGLAEGVRRRLGEHYRLLHVKVK